MADDLAGLDDETLATWLSPDALATLRGKVEGLTPEQLRRRRERLRRALELLRLGVRVYCEAPRCGKPIHLDRRRGRDGRPPHYCRGSACKVAAFRKRNARWLALERGRKKHAAQRAARDLDTWMRVFRRGRERNA